MSVIILNNYTSLADTDKSLVHQYFRLRHACMAEAYGHSHYEEDEPFKYNPETTYFLFNSGHGVVGGNYLAAVCNEKLPLCENVEAGFLTPFAKYKIAELDGLVVAKPYRNTSVTPEIRKAGYGYIKDNKYDVVFGEVFEKNLYSFSNYAKNNNMPVLFLKNKTASKYGNQGIIVAMLFNDATRKEVTDAICKHHELIDISEIAITTNESHSAR